MTIDWSYLKDSLLRFVLFSDGSTYKIVLIEDAYTRHETFYYQYYCLFNNKITENNYKIL